MAGQMLFSKLSIAARADILDFPIWNLPLNSILQSLPLNRGIKFLRLYKFLASWTQKSPKTNIITTIAFLERVLHDTKPNKKIHDNLQDYIKKPELMYLNPALPKEEAATKVRYQERTLNYKILVTFSFLF